MRKFQWTEWQPHVTSNVVITHVLWFYSLSAGSQQSWGLQVSISVQSHIDQVCMATTSQTYQTVQDDATDNMENQEEVK